MAIREIVPVTFFVDWNSQIHAANFPRGEGIEKTTLNTLKYVGRTISRFLNREDQSRRFDVSLRLYHGWYRGFEPVPARKILIGAAFDEDLMLSVYPNVQIRVPFGFGDCLLSANPERFYAKLACHLTNTLRPSSRGIDEVEEKMVDTAIASDVIHLAYSEPTRWLCVLGEDDDLVPPVLTAEAIRGRRGGRVVLLRQRRESKFLKLEGLSVAP